MSTFSDLEQSYQYLALVKTFAWSNQCEWIICKQCATISVEYFLENQLEQLRNVKHHPTSLCHEKIMGFRIMFDREWAVVGLFFVFSSICRRTPQYIAMPLLKNVNKTVMIFIFSPRSSTIVVQISQPQKQNLLCTRNTS